jgi:hypothetical protein
MVMAGDGDGYYCQQQPAVSGLLRAGGGGHVCGFGACICVTWCAEAPERPCVSFCELDSVSITASMVKAATNSIATKSSVQGGDER